jgi:hypothetical protein
MTTSNTTKFTPLSVAFDAFGAHSFCPKPSSRIELEIEWLKVIVGKDSHDNEFVMAYIGFGMHNFTFGQLPPSPRKWHPRTSYRQWVYSLKTMPDEYFISKTPATELIYGDFKVVYGIDSRRRQFLYVMMPSGIVFLFRNPKSRAMLPWSPTGAMKVEDGMVGTSVLSTKQPEKPSVDLESPGDFDLDAFLAKFG